MQPWIRQTLRDRRESAGLTMHALSARAYAAGYETLDKGTISRLESGLPTPQGRRIDDVHVEAYAAALEVEPLTLWADAVKRWRAATKTEPPAVRSAKQRGRSAAQRL